MEKEQQESRTGFRRSLLSSAAFLFVATYAFLIVIPWTPIDFGPGLDYSWNLAMHKAFAEHWVFGQDIMYTAGPWGILYAGFDPRTYPWVIAGWLILTTAFVAALWSIGREVVRSPMALTLWTVAILGAVSMGIRDIFFLSLPALFIVSHFQKRDPGLPTRLILIAALALASETKFSYAVAIVPTMFIVSVDEFFAKPRRLPSGVAYLFLLLCGWVAAGQPLSAVPQYLKSSLLIAQGYGGGMALDRGATQLPVELFVGLALLVVCATGVRDLRLGVVRALLAVSALGWVFLTMAKAGYVRHDIHSLIPEVGIFVVTMINFPSFLREQKPLLRATGVILVFLAFALATSSTLLAENRFLPEYFVSGLSRLSTSDGHVVTPQRLRRSFDDRMRSIRSEFPLPSVRGAVDIYPRYQSAVIASGLQYRPRPLIQSLVTYTTELARLNAAHLQTPAAADYVFFDLMPIDNRYPALDDSLSWPELLTRYDAIDTAGPLLLMRRTHAPRSYSLELIGSAKVPLGKPLFPPTASGDPTWVKIHFRETLVGRLAGVLYKPPLLRIHVTTIDGHHKTYRLISSVSEGGFLLSPRVTDWMSFAALQTASYPDLLRNDEVRSFFVGQLDGLERFMLSGEIEIRYYRLRLPRPLPPLSLQQFAEKRRELQRRPDDDTPWTTWNGVERSTF